MFYLNVSIILTYSLKLENLIKGKVTVKPEIYKFLKLGSLGLGFFKIFSIDCVHGILSIAHHLSK